MPVMDLQLGHRIAEQVFIGEAIPMNDESLRRNLILNKNYRTTNIFQFQMQ